MADIDPSFIPLPRILDPILNYVSSILPPPVYSFIITLLSHSLALFTALFSLSSKLFSSRPWEWDAQTILPPLISFLAAYLALVSLYRTTSWMFRTGIWFVKWGSIIGALVAGAGYFAGAGGNGAGGVGGGGGMGGGMMSFLGGLALDAINGRGQNAAGGTRSRTRSQSRTQSKPWEPFLQNMNGQYRDNTNANARNARNNDGAEDGSGIGMVQDIIGNLVGAAERGGWLDAARSAIDGFQNAGAPAENEDGTGRRKQPARKAKTKARARAGADP